MIVDQPNRTDQYRRDGAIGLVCAIAFSFCVYLFYQWTEIL